MSRPSHQEIAKRFDTPLFLYDASVIKERWQALRSALPDGADMFYAVKANPSLAVLALLRSLGAGAEIASDGEMTAALRAGFTPDRILFAGPGKRDEEIERATELGILVHAESSGEIQRLDAIGRRRDRPVRAGLRVHVPWAADETHTIIGGGEATKFGIQEAEALARAKEFATLGGVRLTSLHVFNASNVLDAEALLRGAERTLSLAAELAREGLPLDQVDIGGGLGVPYGLDASPLDVERFGSGLGPLLEAHRGAFPGRLRIALEPGRYLVAESGLYLTRVLDEKECGGVRFLVVDGGVHHLLRPALFGQAHRVRRISPGEGPLHPYRIAGPLCTSIDSFGDHSLPETGRGDLLAVECAGAYGFTEAMPGFLSHPVPPELLLLEDEVFLVRPRRAAERHLDDQAIPEPLAELVGDDPIQG